MKHNKNNGGNVPNLRFPEFTGEWQKTTLNSIAEIGKGSGISKGQLSLNGLPCILYGELYTKYKSEIITEIISRTDIEASNLFRSKTNDVIIPSSGETAIDISTARYIPCDDVLLGGDLNVIRLKNDDGRFLSYQLNGIRKFDIAKMAQGVSVVHLYGEKLKHLQVVLPEVIEQQKIASLLSLIDERIATQNKIIEDLKLLKSALAEMIFNESYCDTTIGQLCHITMGQSPSSSNYNHRNNGLPLLQGNLDISDGTTNPRLWTTEITKECNVGDIILTVRAPVGNVAKSTVRACIGRGVCSICINNNLHNEYIYQYLIYYENKWSEVEQGSTFASISRNDITSVKIPAVTDKTLSHINTLSYYDLKVNIEKSILDRFAIQKQHLLSQMFI